MSETFGNQPEGTKQFYREMVKKHPFPFGPLMPGEIEWHAARFWEEAQKKITHAMQQAELNGRRLGYPESHINTLVQAAIAANDPENSFYQEMQAWGFNKEIPKDAKMAIFGEYLEGRDKWDRRYLDLAEHISPWSKDPSTKVGAVIVRPDNSIVSLGFNGFARGVRDLPERYDNRDLKIKMIVHAERNAIIFGGHECRGATLYTWPFMPCAVCAGIAIQAGIVRCVAPPTPEHLKARWGEDMAISTMQFEEAGVELCIINGETEQ